MLRFSGWWYICVLLCFFPLQATVKPFLTIPCIIFTPVHPAYRLHFMTFTPACIIFTHNRKHTNNNRRAKYVGSPLQFLMKVFYTRHCRCQNDFFHPTGRVCSLEATWWAESRASKSTWGNDARLLRMYNTKLAVETPEPEALWPTFNNRRCFTTIYTKVLAVIIVKEWELESWQFHSCLWAGGQEHILILLCLCVCVWEGIPFFLLIRITLKVM